MKWSSWTAATRHGFFKNPSDSRQGFSPHKTTMVTFWCAFFHLFHGLFFESVKIKIPNKSYSTPKKYMAGFLESDRNSEFPLSKGIRPHFHMLFTSRVIQESHQVRSTLCKQIRFTEILPWWSSSQQRPYWTTCWWSPNSLEDQKFWQIVGRTKWGMKKTGETCTNIVETGNGLVLERHVIYTNSM